MYLQNAMVADSRLSSPIGKNHFHERRTRSYELRELCPCKDNDMAGAWWLNQPVSEEGFRSRACESNVGSWYDKPLKDPLHLLLVGFSTIYNISSLLRLYNRSPTLIPKPRDWNSHVYVSGFCHLPLASSYTPSSELLNFLESGPQPIYIGFGSIVVSNPTAMTDLLLEAVQKAGVRAIISKGWGDFATHGTKLPEDVFVVGNVPHDWLFPKVSCVIHHGGAGTTAAGLASGKPTIIVPFFGDQPFWGMVVAKAGAGPLPIAFKDLTSDRLSMAIKAALMPEVREKVLSLAFIMSHESGSQDAANSFHTALDVDALRCSLAPDRAAVWRVKRTKIRLSALSAVILIEEKRLSFENLER